MRMQIPDKYWKKRSSRYVFSVNQLKNVIERATVSNGKCQTCEFSKELCFFYCYGMQNLSIILFTKAIVQTTLKIKTKCKSTKEWQISDHRSLILANEKSK